MILVIGATGNTGSETARLLAERGLPVRALTRDPARAAALSGFDRVEVVAGDSARPETLAPAFAGVEKAFLVPPTEPGWDRLEAGLIEAARRAGVRHVVKLSAIGVSGDAPSMSLSFHWRGEQALEASGMAWTHVRGNSFSQNTLMDAPTIAAEGRFYSCAGDARFAKVDTRDIAAVVAKALAEEGHEGRIYELTGPEPLTYADMARKLSAALGREIAYVDMPIPDYERALAAAGVPDWFAKEIADIYGRGFYRESGGSFVTDVIEVLTGCPPRSFDDFARDYADAFRL